MTKKLHTIYEESQKIVAESMGTVDEFSNIEDKAELEFYLTVKDFVMQQRQKEVIRKGIF